MNVKRYFAPTAREALRRHKEELGGEAIVLSNRSVPGLACTKLRVSCASGRPTRGGSLGAMTRTQNVSTRPAMAVAQSRLFRLALIGSFDRPGPGEVSRKRPVNRIFPIFFAGGTMCHCM